MRKTWKRIVQILLDKDAEHIMKKVNRDPSLKDVQAPDGLYDKILDQIREYEEEKEKEKQELIRLGKVYKKNKKRNKILVILAAAIGILALGMTSMGGPKRVYEKVSWMIGGREQTNIDTDDDRLVGQEKVTEEDVYQQIEDEFNFSPVRLDYKPERMEFTEAVIEKDTQNIRLYYEKGSDKVLLYTMLPNYRTTTIGSDIEDAIVNEYTKKVQDVEVCIKVILVEDSQETRWRAEFQYQDVQYFLMMIGFNEEEMEQTVESLYFLK